MLQNCMLKESSGCNLQNSFLFHFTPLVRKYFAIHLQSERTSLQIIRLETTSLVFTPSSPKGLLFIPSIPTSLVFIPSSSKGLLFTSCPKVLCHLVRKDL